MTATPDEIAALVQRHYDTLPAKRKPAVRSNGLREWVPLAGLVAEGNDGKLHCVSLATGMKCLPASKIPQAFGSVLHDWHAEVLAIRAFNHFVLDECKVMLQQHSSEFLRRRTSDEMAAGARGAEGQWNGQPFAWREDFRLYMYCSEAPCGDASMELIMAAQEDATPWDMPPAVSGPETATVTREVSLEPTLPGRAYFSQLGVVRRKPARPDAPPTLSKSCSDKLALKQCVSLLCSSVALLVDPCHVYLDTVVLPASRYSESACLRAFSGSSTGRMRSVRPKGKDEESGCYAFRPFAVKTTTSEFVFSQRTAALSASEANKSVGEGGGQKTVSGIAPSNLAVAWTRSGLQETSLGGTLQGRKQFDPRGASFASRRKIWALAAEVANLVEQVERERGGEGDEAQIEEANHTAVAEIQGSLNARTYGDMKDSALLESRRRAKREARSEALRGWARNTGDESFVL
ncbi:adenosine deaminase/editase [Hypoxylon sp. FL1284]|nr:adenosine deaminase/editase [Hypoxylon sp. FL1284]